MLGGSTSIKTLANKNRKNMFITPLICISLYIYLEDDFVTDCDLYIACVILSKQIEYINGNKDNIIVPSIKMRSIQEPQQSGLKNII